MSEQSNAVSTNKRVQVAQAFWEDDDEEGATIAQRFSNVRKKIKTNLTALVKECHQGVKPEYLLKTTQALVTSNNEIWNRCKANLKNHQTEQFNQLSEKPKLIFQHVGFTVVKALSRMDGNGRSLAPLEFQYQCIEQTKAFSVPCFPLPLRTVVIPSLDKDGMLNYVEYLKRSFILDKSIMHPFLSIFMDHLEQFQVFLGNVESWLKENTQNVTFIEAIFNVNLASSKQVGTNYILKREQYPSNDKSQYNLLFDVSNDNDRKKLTTFLAFIK